MSWQISETGRGDNTLYSQAGTPSLDLRFSSTKSLTDYVTGTNLIDFSRASSGTYVGSDGLIKTATTNLLLQSEDLTAGDWVPIGTVSATLDTSQGQPLENVNVHRIDFSGANEQYRQSYNFANATYTASAYVKGVAGETIRLAIPGVVAITLTLDGTWQLIFVSGAVSAGLNYFSLTTAAGATARTVYVAAPQLEQSSTVGEYIPTTSTINSAPRFDHDPITGESLGLLVEESRTNLLQHSEDQSSWGGFRTTHAVDQITSPDGSVTADLITASQSASGGAAKLIGVSLDPGTFTLSVFAKKNTTSALLLRPTNGAVFAEASEAYFNLDTGQTAGVSDDGVVFTNSTQDIEDFGNDWYRCSVTYTLTSALTVQQRVYIVDSPGSLPVTAGASYYVWGAQLEEGFFRTSYIPTVNLGDITPGYTTPAVTRAADVASISGSNFSSWYRQDEGTVFASYQAKEVAYGKTIYRVTDGTVSNQIQLRYGSGPQIQASTNASGVTIYSIASAALLTPDVTYKTAHAFSASTAALAADGSIIGTSTFSGSLPVVHTLDIASRSGSSELFTGTISRLVYWPQRLPDETLQGITQQ